MGSEKQDKMGLGLLLSSLSTQEKLRFVRELMQETAPVSIFQGKISALAAIVLYLKDHQEFTFAQIAHKLGRAGSTISTTYHKNKGKELDLGSELRIPLDIFSKRKFSVLENLVSYLKREHYMSLTTIAKLLGKSPGTIKTVHFRYRQKCK